MADAQRGIINPKKIHYGDSNGSWNGGKQIYVCEWCGDEFDAYSWAVHKFCSITCARQYQLTGETNPNWKGGITPRNALERKTSQYKEWREKVFARDNFTCRKCGKSGEYLNAHHIKPFALFPDLRLDINNGITLCVLCHKTV
jgi:hypothetical protein